VEVADVIRRDAGVRLDEWLAAVARVAPDGWQAIADVAELPEQVRADSQYWCDQVFSPAANPHDVPGARRAVHRATVDTPDLVRHEYRSGRLDLSVIEGRNFFLVSLDRKGLDVLRRPVEARPAAVKRLAAAIFRVTPEFGACEPLRNGARICTDEAADPMCIPSWSHRVECGVGGGSLWFLCYKRVSQRTGFANPRQWLDEPGR
jgi:hypothetical protein